MSIASLSNAAVISPQTGGGAAIDPSGNSDVDSNATGSALLTTFNALDDRVTQVNWTGIGGTTGNTIDHDAGGDDDGIDVRIAHSPAFVGSVSTLQNYNTGGGGTGISGAARTVRPSPSRSEPRMGLSPTTAP